MRQLKVLIPFLALVVMASTANAQMVEKPWMVEGNAGIVVPSGDFSDAVKTSFAAGGMVGYNLTPAISVMGTFNWAQMTSKITGVGDLTLLSYFGNAGYNVTANMDSPVDVIPFVGAGAQTYSPDVGSSTTKFAIDGGLKFNYYVTPMIAITANGTAILAFTDPSNTWTFPVTGGLLIRF